MSVWATSDLHLNHDKEFIYKPRGFSTIDEMNEAIIERYNNLVLDDDTVYILGDVMLGSNLESGIELIKKLNGNKIIIAGNHDSPRRKAAYKDLGIFVYDALYVKYNGYTFYLSHYPSITSNLEKESLKQAVLNLYGHTHQQTNFFYEVPMLYHVGVDSHDCAPVNFETIIDDIYEQIRLCKECL